MLAQGGTDIDVIAKAYESFVRLVERGKADLAYPTVLASFAIKQVLGGRQVGCRQNVLDVMSLHAQRQKRFTVQRLHRQDTRGQWQELAVEDSTAGPAEIAAFRLDFRDWLARLGQFKRRVALRLAVGDTTTDAARHFRLSRARISQLRRATAPGGITASVPGQFEPIFQYLAIYRLDGEGLTRRGVSFLADRPTKFDTNDPEQVSFKRVESRKGASDKSNPRGEPARRMGAVEKHLIGTWLGHTHHHGESYTFRADGTFEQTWAPDVLGPSVSEGTWELISDALPNQLVLGTTTLNEEGCPVKTLVIHKVITLNDERLAFENPNGPRIGNGQPNAVVFMRTPPQYLVCELRADQERWDVGKAPSLSCTIENTGKLAHLTRLQQGFHHIKVDGHPYVWANDVSSVTNAIPAGGKAEIRFVLDEKNWIPLWSVDVRVNKRLQLSAGKHTVRVCIFAASGGASSLDDPYAGPLMQVWSNAVPIEVVAAPGQEPVPNASANTTKEPDNAAMAEPDVTAADLLGKWESLEVTLVGGAIHLELRPESKFIYDHRDVGTGWTTTLRGVWELEGHRLLLRAQERRHDGKEVEVGEKKLQELFVRCRGGQWFLTDRERLFL